MNPQRKRGLVAWLLLVVGMFMDMTPAILIFTPILLPVVRGLGLSDIHFGIMMIANLCIGLCTQPVGTCLFIGCGVAVRREAFRALGGYDTAFNYYAEEYDLAARMILAGGRVAFEQDFRVTHAKDARGRNMDLILARLVRNND